MWVVIVVVVVVVVVAGDVIVVVVGSEWGVKEQPFSVAHVYSLKCPQHIFQEMMIQKNILSQKCPGACSIKLIQAICLGG